MQKHRIRHSKLVHLSIMSGILPPSSALLHNEEEETVLLQLAYCTMHYREENPDLEHKKLFSLFMLSVIYYPW